MTAPFSSVSEPMSTTPTSPSAGSVAVGTSKIVTSELPPTVAGRRSTR